ncbi:MAG: GNAT family N-acetyltransferase [Candidatus Omnitrophica bacterium]|nr:GNAT family N-acetyltransferase [Candidatus Omnitrophota bacterium]
MKIRSFDPQDAEGVKSLISSVMSREYPAEEKAYQYGDLDDVVAAYGSLREKFLVAEEGAEVIGAVGIKEDSSATALLRRLFVHPSHRGRGVGSMLVDTAMDFCKMNGYEEVVFRATSKMTQAINLLATKKGFAEKEKYLFDDLEIVILHHKTH